MTLALVLTGAVFVLVFGPIGVLAWRRPLLARLAYRESTRGRAQFAVLVVGLMVASVSITASLVATDSGLQTFASFHDERLGAVDLTVTAAGGRSFPLDVAQQLASDPTLTPYVDGVQAGVETPVSVADLDRRLGKSNVLLVGFDPASQPRFGAYMLIDGRRDYGSAMVSGDVLLSRGLATALDAKAGDHLRFGTGWNDSVGLRVYGIATAGGAGSYGSYLAAYMPLATAQLVTQDPGINVVRIAARGGGPADPRAADRARAPLRAAVSRIAAGGPLVADEVRFDAASQLDGITAAVVGPYLGFSALTVLAAIGLIVNLILALAEERRPRLAVLRALGLTRAGLVLLSMLEGAIYSVAAAAAGVAVGVPAGLYLAGQLWNAAITDPTDQAFIGFPLQLTVRPGTLALAFAAGALITLGTVAGAAYLTSRIAIAAAIRDLPDPAAPARRRWPRTALLVSAAAIAIAVLIPNDPRTRLVSGIALIAVVVALGRGRLPDRARFTLAGLLVTGWAGIITAGINAGADLYQIVTVIFMGVAFAAMGLTVAVAANLRLIESAVGLAGNRAGLVLATLRPTMAYLSRRPVRTGLATSAFALVMAMVTGIALVAGGPKPVYARDSAGFDVEVVTSGPNPIILPPALEQQVEMEIALPKRLYQGPAEDGQPAATVPIYVLPDNPVGVAPVYLRSRDKRFASNAEVWQALARHPDLVVDASYGLGDTLTLEGVTGPVLLGVVGHEGPTVLQGVIVSQATLAEIETTPAGSTLLLKTRPGSDPVALGLQIERALFDQGVQASAIREILDQDHATNEDYITEYDTLLHTGLLAGVLALAMIGIRAAIERRRTIGIQRALGYQPLRVVAGLLAEAATTASIGVVTGIAAGLLMAFWLVHDHAVGTPVIEIPLARLGIALAIVYGTVLIVTLPPAMRAARMAPTEAIRMTG